MSLSFSPPDNELNGSKVHLYLLDLLDRPPLRGGVGLAPLQFSLRYLVATSIGAPRETRHLIEQLIFAALESPDFEVELKGLPPATWTALAAIPRPCFVISVLARKARPEPPAKLVLHPLQVEVTSITSLQGAIVGPNSMPWVGAYVELPALQVSTRTNTRGIFRFPSVPREPRRKRLHIKARGKVFDVTVTQPESAEETALIQLDPLAHDQQGSESQL